MGVPHLVRACHRLHAAIFASSASTRSKPAFAPSSTPYCIVVSRCSGRLEVHRLRQLRLLTEILELERLQVVLERLHEALGRLDLAELALDHAEGGSEPVGAAGTNVHLLDDGSVAPPFGDQLRIRPDGVDVCARCVEDPLDADLELVRSGNRGLVHLQLTACLRSFVILASSALVSLVNAKATGHIDPSSRLAVSLKPSIA